MSDLISRQDAIERLREFANDDMTSTEKAIGADYCVDLIRTMPSAKPEIIHCKDCKWSAEDYDTDGNVPYWICKNWDGGTDADGFCYEAERRTE